MRMTDIVSFIDDALFRSKDRKSLMIEFIAFLVYILLFILCTAALYAAHRSLVRALLQSQALFILLLPGAGALMCIFREPNRNVFVDKYVEQRLFTGPIVLVGQITFVTFGGLFKDFHYLSGNLLIRFFQIFLCLIMILKLIVLIWKSEIKQWSNHSDKIRFQNSSVAIFSITATIVLFFQFMLITDFIG